MENWDDHGIILSARQHGESGAVVSCLTEQHGRQKGYVNGALSKRNRALVEAGAHVELSWQARTSDQLGRFTLEPAGGVGASALLNEPLKLSALQSACALCDLSLPDGDGHAGLYHGFLALIDALSEDHWGVSYVVWEMALLRELGFGLDLSRCAGGGSHQDIAYMSPKSGCAVSQEKGELYKHKLLALPEFLKRSSQSHNLLGSDADIYTGIKMTGYFFENRVFAQHSQGIPPARLRFAARFAKYIGLDEIE
jgi:DNA repair protein RecO (recombination protein O)